MRQAPTRWSYETALFFWLAIADTAMTAGSMSAGHRMPWDVWAVLAAVWAVVGVCASVDVVRNRDARSVR